MKTFIAFTILIAGISALPQPENDSIDFRNERLLSGTIKNAIEKISKSIQEAGLDPLYIERQSSEFALPVPVIFNYAAFIEEVLSSGLSDIKVNKVDYSLLTSRLTFDIELPLVQLALGAGSVRAEIFGNDFLAMTSGRVEVRRIRVEGQVRISIGIISGISIRSINITFTLGSIESNVNLAIQNKDYSAVVNNFLSSTITSTLETYHDEINELLEIVLLDVINANLPF